MGEPLQHDVYTMNVDVNNLANRDLNSREIYIMRVHRTDLRRLTENNYCDYQPRWWK